MVKAIVLILTLVRLLLTEGLDSNPAESNNEATTSSVRRILHGAKADLPNFRFMVRIIWKGTCTGSIIASNWVLTAAHCVHNAVCTEVEIYPAAWKPTEKINPTECFVHDRYNDIFREHDVAVLRLGNDILWDLRARALNLPPPGTHHPPGTPAVIVGWGRTEKDESPETLLNGEVQLATRDTCTAQYWANFPECETVRPCGHPGLPLRIVCAVPTGSTPPGICYGDSGGPIIADRYVIGISTMLITPDGTCKVGAASAFLNIVDYLPWIYSHTEPSKDTSMFEVGPEHDSP